MKKRLTPLERAKLLLNEMSIDEKLAQINCYYFFDGRDEEPLKDGIGVISCLEFRGHGKVM